MPACRQKTFAKLLKVPCWALKRGTPKFTVDYNGNITSNSVGTAAIQNAVKQSFLQLPTGNTGLQAQFIIETVPFVGGSGTLNYSLPSSFPNSNIYCFITQQYTASSSTIWGCQPNGLGGVTISYNTAISGQV